MNELTIQTDFLDKHLFCANHTYSMVYLYALRYKNSGEAVPDSGAIAKKLGMKTSDVDDAVAYWRSEGFDIFQSLDPKPVRVDKSNYSAGEITSFIESDIELRFLYSEAQRVLGKALSTGDIQTLFWLYDYLGLSGPVIMLIITYAAKQSQNEIY